MIYIDPPYNTGKDFIYPDNYYQDKDEYIENSGQIDDEGSKLVPNLETNGRFHTDWLNMMYPRLMLARDLLSEDGVIFISIDDNEQENLKKICNEIFGENNFIAQLIWDLGTGTTAGQFTRAHEYILCFTKNINALKNFSNYNRNEKIAHGALKKISKKNPAVEITFPIGFEFAGDNATFTGELGISEKEYILSEKMEFKNGKLISPTRIKAGFAMKNQIEDFIQGKEVFDTKGQKVTRFYFNANGILFYEKEKTIINPKTVLSQIANTKNGTSDLKLLINNSSFNFPKPVKLINYLAKLSTSSNDIILDFFSGSATTAHAVMQLNAEDGGNRKFIMVQLPEKTDEKSEAFKAGYPNICEIGKERIRRAGAKIRKDIEDSIAAAQCSLDKLKQEQEKKANLFDDDEFKQKMAGFQQTIDSQSERLKSLDTGFRVFKVDESNMKDVFYTPEEYIYQDLADVADNIKDDRTPEDLLFQVMLEYGIYLSSEIKVDTIAGRKVFNVDNNYLIACFDNDITKDVVEAIAKAQPEYTVLSCSCIPDDSVLTNFEQIFKRYAPYTICKMI